MSLSRRNIPFGVKSSNSASVAGFTSMIEDSYILIVANSVSNAALFGVNSVNSAIKQEAYIGIQNNDVTQKIAKFNNESIKLDVNTIINGNLIPNINNSYDLGSFVNRWNNIYVNKIYGDGRNISNLNLTLNTTSELAEGSNQYFTNSRVANIINASNLYISNYIVNTSNTLFRQIRDTSNYVRNTRLELINKIDNDLQANSTFYANQISFLNTKVNNLNADRIANGSTNKFIVNDKYGDLTIDGTLTASNLNIIGSTTIVGLQNYSTEYFELRSDTFYLEQDSSLSIIQTGVIEKNIFKATFNDLNVFVIKSIGNVGIGVSNPTSKLEVDGDVKASLFTGDGSGISNINLYDKDTSSLQEGSNLYFTNERVAAIVIASNNDTSNFITNVSSRFLELSQNTNQNLSNYVITTSNSIFQNIIDINRVTTATLNLQTSVINNRINLLNNDVNSTISLNALYNSNYTLLLSANNSNYTTTISSTLSCNMSRIESNLIARINTTDSNLLSQIRRTDSNLSNFILERNSSYVNTFNSLQSQINSKQNALNLDGSKVVVTSISGNVVSSPITVTQLNYLANVNNDVQQQINTINTNIQTLNADNIANGNVNRFIVNNTYNDYLYVKGTLYVSKIKVFDSTSYVNLTTQLTSNLQIINDGNSSALNIVHKSSYANIIDVYNTIDNVNIPVFFVTKMNNVGIGITAPTEKLEVDGTIKATSFQGRGNLLFDVNFNDRSTSLLQEGSNLYFTAARVANITNASNNILSNLLTLAFNTSLQNTNIVTSNSLINYVNTTSNNIIRYANINFANVSNYVTDTSNILNINIRNMYLKALTDSITEIISTSNTLVTRINTVETNSIVLINNVSNLMASNILQSQNTAQLTTRFALLESNINNVACNLSQTSNSIVNNIWRLDTNQSNYAISTSNILVANLLNISNLVITFNRNQSNYIDVTSNILVNNLNRQNINQSNYLISTSNIIVNNNILIDRNQSNYVISTSNFIMNNLITFDRNHSNYVILTSNFIANQLLLTSNTINNLSINIVQTSNNLNRLNIDVSNLVVFSCNLFANTIRLDINQSNYINSVALSLIANPTQTSNNIVTNMLRLDNNQSNYALNISNILINIINTVDRNQSNNVRNTSNHLFNTFVLYDNSQSNFVRNTSNALINLMNNNNINQSNYVINISNLLSFNSLQTSNNIIRYVINIDNNQSNYVRNISNAINSYILQQDRNQSNYISNVNNRVNIINSQLSSFSNQFVVTSNTITSNTVFILNYVNSLSNTLQSNINAIANKYSFLTNADQMNNGIRQQFIIDNIYANNLSLIGNITPYTDKLYNIGSTDKQWSNIYISNSIYLNNSILTIDSSTNALNIQASNQFSGINVAYTSFKDLQDPNSIVNIKCVDNKLKIYNQNSVINNCYAFWEFKASRLNIDSTIYNKFLITKGTYELNENKNSLLLNSLNSTFIANENWGKDKFTISAWIKGRNLQNGDKILNFTIDTDYAFYNNVQNLAAWWKFDNTFNDTINNTNLILSTDTLPTISSNIFRTGNSAAFLRTSNRFPAYLSIPASLNLSSISIYGITFSLWFKIDYSNKDIYLVNFSDYANNILTTQLYIRRNVNNQYVLYLYNNQSFNSYTFSLSDNYWHHLAWSISFTGFWQIYIDNNYINPGISRQFYLLANRTWTQQNIGIENAIIDDLAYLNTQTGLYIDDFRIYNKVLSKNEVNSLYKINTTIILLKNANNLEFIYNDNVLLQTPYIDNSWFHFIWNFPDKTSNIGFVKINDRKTFYNSAELVNGTYTNQIANIQNNSLVNLSDLCIYTGDISSNVESILYNSTKLYNTLIDNTDFELLDNAIVTTSNNIIDRLNKYYDYNQSNYINNTSISINNRITNLDLNQIADGTSNKFIKYDIYQGNLTVTGILNASNLNITGNTTIINTNTYTTENLEIVTDANDGISALKVTQKGGLNIAEFYDTDSNVLIIQKGGNVGIGTSLPTDKLHVIGNIKFTANINGISSNELSTLTGINTNIQTQFYDTSNYVLSTSNAVVNNVMQLDANMSNYVLDTSNSIIYNIEKINNRFSKLTLNEISNGTSNTFIQNGKIAHDLFINGTLTSCNLNVIGNTTTINTTSYMTENLEIISEYINAPALKIQQNSFQNIAEFYDINAIVLMIQKGGNIGIGTLYPTEKLDIVGNIKFDGYINNVSSIELDYIKNVTSPIQLQLDNLFIYTENVSNNLNNLTTSLATNATNTSNYVLNTSNTLINYINTIGKIQSIDSQQLYIATSNFVSSNYLTTSLATNATNVSNQLYLQILQSSNNILQTINKLFNQSNTIYSYSNILNSYILSTSNINADNIIASNLTVLGTATYNDLNIDNILINNNISIFNNSIFNSKCLDIVNFTDNPAINILQIGNGNIFQVQNNYDTIFVMNSNGFIGNKTNPLFNIDIDGTIKSTFFRGDGDFLYNVNLRDKTTTELKEGSNLYYTDNRVYNVLYSSNYFVNNPFIPIINNVYSNLVIDLDALRDDISDTIARINLDNVVQGDDHKYIVRNIYNDSLVINGTLTVKHINIIETDSDYYDDLYTSNLYTPTDATKTDLFSRSTNLSNIILSIFDSYSNDIATDCVTVFEEVRTDINDINIDIANIDLEIDNIKESFYYINLDNVIQGSNNQYIVNNMYNNSLLVNGTLTVRDIRILDVDNDYYNDSYQASLYNPAYGTSSTLRFTGNSNISNIAHGIAIHYSNMIRNVYDPIIDSIHNDITMINNDIYNLDSNIHVELDDVKESLFYLSLDNILQGANNQYIVNNIFNNSLLVNGTLTVKDIRILDIDDDSVDNVYNCNLYNPINGSNKYSYTANNKTSNIANAISKMYCNLLRSYYDPIVDNLYYNVSNLYTDTQNIHTDVYYLTNYINIAQYNINILNDHYYSLIADVNVINNDIDGIQSNIISIQYDMETIRESMYYISLDNVIQGDKNKYIVNDIYNTSLLVNGTLTVRDIRILDVDEDYYTDIYSSNLYNPEDTTSRGFVHSVNTNISNIVFNIFNEKDYDKLIQDKYETLVYALSEESRILSNRIVSLSREFINTSNQQVNEINLLKNNVNILTSNLLYLYDKLAYLL